MFTIKTSVEEVECVKVVLTVYVGVASIVFARGACVQWIDFLRGGGVIILFLLGSAAGVVVIGVAARIAGRLAARRSD